MTAALALALFAQANANASRILIPQHEQGSILIVDDRLIQPNQVIAGLPGVHALASNGKNLAIAAIKPPSGTTEGFEFQLAIIDIAAGRVTRQVDVAGDVGHAAMSGDGRLAALTHPDRRLVSLIDVRAGKKLAEVPIDGQPAHLVFSRDGGQLFVSDQESGRLSIISTAKPKKVESFEGLDAFGHLAIDPSGTIIYAANSGNGSVGVVLIGQRKRVGMLEIGTEIHGIALSPDGKQLFAADFGEGAVVAVEVDSGKRRSVPVAPGPYHVTALTDTRQLLVTSADENLMWSISAPSLKIVASYRLEGIVDQIPEVGDSP